MLPKNLIIDVEVGGIGTHEEGVLTTSRFVASVNMQVRRAKVNWLTDTGIQHLIAAVRTKTAYTA